jgi:Uma2 family endonuclease
MKAVMANVPEHILEWRRRTGADQWDEMWEGVLHMAPSPNREHQDFELALAMWLRTYWGQPNGSCVYTRINVAEPGTWPNNFRIPDIVMVTPARFRIDRNEYFEGGPDVVIEIHSPGDESYDKLLFYASVGVREVWIVDRDNKRPEVYELIDGAFQMADPIAEDWIQSKVTGIEMRGVSQDQFEIRLISRDDTRAKLP